MANYSALGEFLIGFFLIVSLVWNENKAQLSLSVSNCLKLGSNFI